MGCTTALAAGPLRMSPVTSDEFIHNVDQCVQALAGLGLRLAEPVNTLGELVHSLNQPEFSRGQAAHQVRNLRQALVVLSRYCLQAGQPLVVPGGRRLEARLRIEDELHGLFDVHERNYNPTFGSPHECREVEPQSRGG